MTALNKHALREAAENATGAHERLSIIPADDIFDISLHEGTQLDADITALNAFNDVANPSTMLALLDELEKAQAQSSKWCEAFHKAVSVGARYEERIVELEAKLEAAEKLQDSAFRHGLQHGFSYGQTNDQAGFEQCLAAYSQEEKGNG